MNHVVSNSLFLSALGIYLHAISIALVIGGSITALFFEIMYKLRRLESYHRLSYIIMKIVAIVFAFGAVSGTVVEFGLVQVWTGFLIVMGTFALFPFYIELLAFMLEAGLLAFLVYGWNRFKGKYTHIVLISLIAFGSNLSGALIMVANSWMNVPWGVGDLIKQIYPWAPIYGPKLINEKLFYEIKSILMNNSQPLTKYLSYEVLNNLTAKYGPLLKDPWIPFKSIYSLVSIAHQLIATIIAGGSWYAVMLAYRYYRGEDRILQPLLDFLLLLSVLMIIQGVIGHDMGVQVIEYQPTKFALIAGLRKSGPDPIAGLTTFGDPNHIFHGFDYFINVTENYTQNIGIQNFQRDIALNDVYTALSYMTIVFPLYSSKIALAVLAGIIGLIFMYSWLKPYLWSNKKKLMIYLTYAFSILVTIVSALGWAVRELGRKPWTIYGMFYPRELISIIDLNIWTTSLIIGGLLLSLSMMLIVIYLYIWRGAKWV